MYELVDEELTRVEQFEAGYVVAWPAVYRFALAWTNDRQEALDAAQETFARLWERRGDYDLAVSMVPLALTVERRLLIDRGRRLVRQAKLLLRLGVSRQSSTVSNSDGWLDVQAAFGELTRIERTALIGLAIEGRTSEELSELLGMSAGAVRAAASRGRQKLRAIE